MGDFLGLGADFVPGNFRWPRPNALDTSIQKLLPGHEKELRRAAGLTALLIYGHLATFHN
jgi:hypothetical protein